MRFTNSKFNAQPSNAGPQVLTTSSAVPLPALPAAPLPPTTPLADGLLAALLHALHVTGTPGMCLLVPGAWLVPLTGCALVGSWGRTPVAQATCHSCGSYACLYNMCVDASSSPRQLALVGLNKSVVGGVRSPSIHQGTSQVQSQTKRTSQHWHTRCRSQAQRAVRAS
jgi:hypothetical protein